MNTHHGEKSLVTPSDQCRRASSCSMGKIISCIAYDETSIITEEDQIDSLIENVWKKIDHTVEVYSEKYKQLQPTDEKNHLGWRVVRLFISSTFADFHAEREIIVKKVMPELREWCEQYQIHLIECDLRWGVPKNTDTAETIQICLDELSRCVEETHGQPFFLNLLGERYGWIPSKEMLPTDLVSSYDWVYPASITHMEVIHAALRTNSQNSLFLIRRKASLDNLPSSFFNSFFDSSILAQKSLDRLKDELANRYPKQVSTYISNVSGIDTTTGLEKVAFEGLDTFASLVTDFYKTRITEYASNFIDDSSNIELSESDKLSMIQDIFIEKRGRLLIGREHEIEAMMNFVSNLEDDEKCLFVIAEPGTGKSSLVANYVIQLNQGNIPCLYNFSSSSPGSTSSIVVLKRFCDELEKIDNENNGTQNQEENESEPPNEKDVQEGIEKKKEESYDELLDTFNTLLEKVSSKLPGFTIVLDAVNQFNDYMGRSCEWLPVPSEQLNIRYVISCTPDFGVEFDKLTTKFQNHSKRIYLSGFDKDCRKELAVLLFSHYNKKLDPEQLDMLTNLEAASSPLWLALACEELRVFGVFEQVTEKIKNLPGTITDLISSIIHRIISEDETENVEKALCFIHCSTHGLSESELRVLLHDDNENMLPMMSWLQIRRKIKCFLLNTGVKGHEDMFTFFHSSVTEVISTVLLADKTKRKEFNKSLATYFLQHGKTGFRASNEIFNQLKDAEMCAELVTYLRTDKRSMSIGDVNRSQTLRKFQCQQIMMSGSSPFKFPVHMCNMCAIKTRLCSPTPLLTKELCIVCGKYNPRKTIQAFVCQRHRQHCAPGTDKCIFCKKVIFVDKKTPMRLFENGYLCTFCSIPNKCVTIVT